MMFLRFRYRLGFEVLGAEVADSLAHEDHHSLWWEGLGQLNEALVAKADAAKVVTLNKMLADSPVVEAKVAYPSDADISVWARRSSPDSWAN
jgi:IS5 family transposase